MSKEPIIHTHISNDRGLPENHPLRNQTIHCNGCGDCVYEYDTTRYTWVEFGNACVCFVCVGTLEGRLDINRWYPNQKQRADHFSSKALPRLIEALRTIHRNINPTFIDEMCREDIHAFIGKALALYDAETRANETTTKNAAPTLPAAVPVLK